MNHFVNAWTKTDEWFTAKQINTKINIVFVWSSDSEFYLTLSIFSFFSLFILLSNYICLHVHFISSSIVFIFLFTVFPYVQVS